jgi:hypothetical protein
VIKFVSLFSLSGTKVDRKANIIRGVSLISLGEARGHDKAVDQKTLETVLACAKEYADGLRVRFNPETFQHGPAALTGRIPVSSMRIENGKAVGDLHLFKTLPENIREYLYEIAEETPGNIGLSIEFTGDDETIDGQKFARCDEIFAATIVDMPAANKGLFSVGAFENLTKDTDTVKPHNGDSLMTDEEIKKLSTGIATSLGPVIKQAFQEAMPAPAKSDDDKKKEEMAAAGVTDGDDDATKKDKVEKYRAGQALARPVSTMSAKDIVNLVGQANMQFFRGTGGKPAKVSADVEDRSGEDEFEKLVSKHMETTNNRGLAVNRARQDNPTAYNAFMDRQHPNKQHMIKRPAVVKK